MALTSPIAWSTFEDGVKNWFANATGLTTIWAGQGAPQPPYPFARLKLIAGPTKYGNDDERHTTDPDADPGEEVVIEICGDRDVTISCQVYCSSDAPGANAQHYLGIAQASLGMPSVLATLRASGIAFVDSMPPQDIDFIAGGAFKSRAGMDVQFRVASSLTDRTGYIESATITANYKNPDGTTAVAVEATYGA